MTDIFGAALRKMFYSPLTQDATFNGKPIKVTYDGDGVKPAPGGGVERVCMAEGLNEDLPGIVRDDMIIINLGTKDAPNWVTFRVTAVLPTYKGTTPIEISRES